MADTIYTICGKIGGSKAQQSHKRVGSIVTIAIPAVKKFKQVFYLGDMQTALALINFPFHFIGISETRENYSSGFKMNKNLDGCTLHSQPSKSAGGGVAIYTTLNAFKQADISTTDGEFETIWVEKVNTKAKNIICCYSYRHPSFNPVRFKEHLKSTLSHLTRENKTMHLHNG